jgi:hypothetical protein
MNPPALQTAAETHWKDGYECLREHALGGAAPSNGWLSSLALLLQKGVAAWLLAEPLREARPEGSEGCFVPSAWSGSQRETTQLLAEMTLSKLFARTPGIQ